MRNVLSPPGTPGTGTNETVNTEKVERIRGMRALGSAAVFCAIRIPPTDELKRARQHDIVSKTKRVVHIGKPSTTTTTSINVYVFETSVFFPPVKTSSMSNQPDCPEIVIRINRITKRTSAQIDIYIEILVILIN